MPAASEHSEIALTVLAIISAVMNAAVAMLFLYWDAEDDKPDEESGGAWWHMVSNCVFLLPMIPFAIHARPTAAGGMHMRALSRANLLLTYVFVMSTISFLHHSMEYMPSRLYKSYKTVPLLWRSIDWSLARMSVAVGVHATLGIEDLVRIARPSPQHWWIRNLVTYSAAGALVLVAMNDMRYVASEPFSDASVTGTVLWGIGATVMPLVLIAVVGGTPTLAVLWSHYFGWPHGLLRTTNLVVCVLAAATTRIEGDDDSGMVHSMWHLTTASILAAAMCLVFDGCRYSMDMQHRSPAATTESALARPPLYPPLSLI